MADEPQEENKPPEEAPKRRQREYMDVSKEPSNKGFLIVFVAIIAIVALAFGYFMIFHFNDAFYEKKVVRVHATD